MRLPAVFSDKALFQADSSVTLHGETAGRGVLIARFTKNDTVLTEVKATVGDDGRFEITLPTPGASFDEYTVALTCGDDRFEMREVLFGELWLGAGQSNMEFPSGSVVGHEDQYRHMAGKALRFFHEASYQGKPDGSPGAEPGFDMMKGPYPWDPLDTTPGQWGGPEDLSVVDPCSALGLTFAESLFDALGVPVGFLNANLGATSIYTWFPRAEIDADPAMQEILRKCDADATPENWNCRKDDMNFQAPAAQFNVKIAPLLGVKVRGVVWYQGENETGHRLRNSSYYDFWKFYRKCYQKLFAADPDRFPIVPALLYSWTYGGDSECHVGCLNQAFIRAAVLEPDTFSFAPTCDLEPSWKAFPTLNHPIHPTHKYALGRRMAKLALSLGYGFPGQKHPAVFSGEIDRDGSGNRLILRFDSVGDGLFVRNAPRFAGGFAGGFAGDSAGGLVRGLYVRGENTPYLPAYAEVVASDRLAVWADGVDRPVHVLYAMQSFDVLTGLFAGEYPVAPFASEDVFDVPVEQRPYYDAAITSRWVFNRSADLNDAFLRPVFRPLPGSAVCPDTALHLDDAVSLHVDGDEIADGESFGCAVKSYRYHRLDFGHFSEMTLNLLGPDNDLDARLALVYDNQTVEIPFALVENRSTGWKSFRAPFGQLPEGEILRFELRFKTASPYRVVNVEHIRLK